MRIRILTAVIGAALLLAGAARAQQPPAAPPDGRLIGAIGCSGGTGSQDEVVCQAGAATINK